MPKAYNSVKKYIKLPKIIHIVGTNGKGSTGRFLAYILYKNGCSVGHYTSPHILRFNERVWLNGEDATDAILEKAHQKLQLILPKIYIETLSYFEYTTLLAAIVFERVDFAIFEAGLGGEFDATNVFEKRLSLITLIDFDHQAFLGNSIKEIAATKIRSIEKEAILGYQKHKEVIEIAKDIANEKGAKLYQIDEILSFEDKKKIEDFIEIKNFPPFFYQNLSLACLAAKILKQRVDLNLLKEINIKGRMQKIAKNIIVDVGHNRAAAEAIVKALEKNVVLVYNSYEDKDYEEILKILKPKLEWVEIIDIDDERAVNKEELKRVLKKLEIKYKDFDIKNINSDKTYLVFGSFKVAETFLKKTSKSDFEQKGE